MVSARPSQGVPAMKRFLICFRVEQTFTASIEVEADSHRQLGIRRLTESAMD